jgi:hypothetical protein
VLFRFSVNTDVCGVVALLYFDNGEDVDGGITRDEDEVLDIDRGFLDIDERLDDEEAFDEGVFDAGTGFRLGVAAGSDEFGFLVE